MQYVFNVTCKVNQRLASAHPSGVTLQTQTTTFSTNSACCLEDSENKTSCEAPRATSSSFTRTAGISASQVLIEKNMSQ